jgi:hypothetical protein
MKLNEKQIQAITSEVERYIITPTLRDDLIDHLCCEIEEKLKSGESFQEALDQAINVLSPGGLSQIQDETNFLLESKFINMKKITYLLGLFTAMAMSFGWLLRILRMGEIGNAVFAFGVFGFIVLFLPLLGILYFRANSKKPWYAKGQIALATLSFIFVGMAWLFKIMHLPGADETMLVGGVLFTFGFLPFLFLNFYKKSTALPEPKQ